MDFQINKIKLDPTSYRHYWFGVPGIGKSSTYRDLILKLYNNDPTKGLLIVTGEESGHKALDNLQFQQTVDWSSFVDTVDFLVEHKSENDIHVVGIDTVDELIEIAIKEVLNLHRIQKKEKATSIKAAFGGYGAGKRMVMDLIETQIGRLDRSGYCLIYIGHSKFKDLTNKETDEQYQMLTSNLENDYHALFANKCDVMCVMQIKRNIKEGRLTGEKRIMRFRASLDVDAKSRIAGLPEEVELSAENYLAAVSSTLKKLSGLSDKEYESRRIEEVNKRNESSENFIKQETEETYGTFDTVEEYKDAIMEIIGGLGPESRAQLKANLKAKGLPEKFTTLEDIKKLKLIYALANGK